MFFYLYGSNPLKLAERRRKQARKHKRPKAHDAENQPKSARS